jgi:type 1 glutamine amidotransferase
MPLSNQSYYMRRAGVVLLAFFLAAAAPLAAQNSIPLFKSGALRALILSGRNNHDWRNTTPFLRQLLIETGRFDVRVNEEPAGMTGETLAAYDVVVLDYNGPRWGSGAENALSEYIRGGKGLVVVHGASWAFNGLPVLGDNHVRTRIIEPAWPEYARIIGGVWSLESPATAHAPYHTFTVKIVDRDHPAMRGLPESFETKDELFHNMRMQQNVHILATAWDDPENKLPNGRGGGTGKDEPVIWTVAYGSGRVFHTILGHGVESQKSPGFGATFVHGAEWAATGGVK